MFNEGPALEIAQSLTKKSEPVAQASGEIVISSDEEYQQAAQFLIDLKTRQKEVEAKRKEFTQPLYDLQKKLNAFFKEPLANYQKAEQALKNAMAKFQIKKEAERKAALEAANKAAQEENKEAFTESMVKAADNLAPDAKGTYTVDVPRFEVTNPELVPREYLMVDEKKIRGVVNSLGTDADIPGVRVWIEKSIRARTS
jgi:exonuclease VII large subunit